MSIDLLMVRSMMTIQVKQYWHLMVLKTKKVRNSSIQKKEVSIFLEINLISPLHSRKERQILHLFMQISSIYSWLTKTAQKKFTCQDMVQHLPAERIMVILTTTNKPVLILFGESMYRALSDMLMKRVISLMHIPTLPNGQKVI